MTTHRFPLARAAEAIDALAAGLPGFVKAAVEPNAVIFCPGAGLWPVPARPAGRTLS